MPNANTIQLNVKPIVVYDEEEDLNLVLSLWGMGSKKQISIPTPGPGRYPDTNFGSFSVNSNAMLDIGFNSSAVVRTNTSAQMVYWIWNFLRTRTIKYEESESAIVSAKWGIGVRMGIVGWNISADLTVISLNKLAASTSLGMASALYDIQLLGAQLEALDGVRELISNAYGSFNLEQLELIGRAQQRLVEYFRENEDKLTPRLLSVEIDTSKLDSFSAPIPTLDSRATIPYTLERVYARKTLNEATNVRDQTFIDAEREGATAESIKHFYNKLFELDGDDLIEDVHRDKAWTKLWTGR